MNRIAMIVAVGLACLAFLLNRRHQERVREELQGGPPVNVLVVISDVEAGQAVTEENLGVRKLPKRYLSERMVLADSLAKIVGVHFDKQIPANETLMWTDLRSGDPRSGGLASKIATGQRAVAIDIGSRSRPAGLLRPGDHVDILFTSARGSISATSPLLQNIEVLAVGSAVGEMEQPENEAYANPVVTVGVSTIQAQALVHAQASGTLSVVIRNGDDNVVVDGIPNTTLNDITEVEHVRKLNRPAKKSSNEREIERVR